MYTGCTCDQLSADEAQGLLTATAARRSRGRTSQRATAGHAHDAGAAARTFQRAITRTGTCSASRLGGGDYSASTGSRPSATTAARSRAPIPAWQLTREDRCASPTLRWRHRKPSTARPASWNSHGPWRECQLHLHHAYRHLPVPGSRIPRPQGIGPPSTGGRPGHEPTRMCTAVPVNTITDTTMTTRTCPTAPVAPPAPAHRSRHHHPALMVSARRPDHRQPRNLARGTPSRWPRPPPAARSRLGGVGDDDGTKAGQPASIDALLEIYVPKPRRTRRP